MSIGAVIAFFAGQAVHRSYPVVDKEGRLIGLVSRSDALRWQVDGAPVQATLAEVLSDASQPYGTPSDPISRIADMMVDAGIGRIPIVEPASSRVIGIVARQDLLKLRSVHHGAEVARTRG